MLHLQKRYSQYERRLSVTVIDLWTEADNEEAINWIIKEKEKQNASPFLFVIALEYLSLALT